MASSSRSSTNNIENFDVLRRICHHKIPAVLRTSRSDKNPGRRYSCCRYRFGANDCGFWEWHDEELTPYYKLYFLSMKAERDDAMKNHLPLNHGRVEFGVDEDIAPNMNEEECTTKNEDLFSLTKAMSLSLKNLEYQIRLIYVAFAFVLLMFVVVYKG